MRGTNDSPGERRDIERIRAMIVGRLAQLHPLAFILASWWLAIIAIALLRQAHAGAHEPGELAPLLHLLRDAALAVPLAGVAVASGSLLLGLRLGRSWAATYGPKTRDRLLWALLVAGTFAVLSIPGIQIHGALFGIGAEPPTGLADVARDAAIAVIGALLALVPLALVAGPSVRRTGATRGSFTESIGPAGPQPVGAIARSAK